MDIHAELFNGLGDPTRLRLLNLLTQAKEICVCELVDALQVPQYNISRHLHVLLKTGIVQDHKRGKWVYYSMAKDLKPYQRTLLRVISELRDEREDLHKDEARAGRRLKLRSGGVCCVGLVSKIGISSRDAVARSVAVR
jgi:ArsR family transcriptional regulator